MISYGKGPADDEIEVSLFGPGFGEAVAVHLGDGAWLLVDSCIDPRANEPATAIYLDAIGVPPANIRSIVASHWHDDHVRGMSKLVAKYSDAEFIYSAVFSEREAKAFLASYCGVEASSLSKGTRELYAALRLSSKRNVVRHRSIVLQERLNGRDVMVTALSPTAEASDQALAHLLSNSAEYDQPIISAPALNPNLAAVALHIDLGDDAIVLGADLEEHARHGWSAVLSIEWVGRRRRASVFKVSHHGGHSAYCETIWSQLLTEDASACLTPFTQGSVRLPTTDDAERIRTRTTEAYISSASSRKPQMDSRQVARLNDLVANLSVSDPGFGAVRFRRNARGEPWRVELFGNAQRL